MIALIIVYCLAAHGTDCHEQRLLAPDGAGPMACMVEGQRAALAWLAAHPGYRLATWRCEAGGRREAA